MYFYRNLFKLGLLLKTMSDPANRWFDQKYDSQGKPTHKDKAALFKQAGLPFSDRAKTKLDELVNYYLFELKREYSPSSEALAHGFIFCLAPVAGVDETKLDSWIAQYDSIMKKYEGKSVFSRNFN